MKTAQWAFPLAVTLHNLEEAVWLPAFWNTRSWHVPISAAEFRLLASAISILAFLITYLSMRGGAKSTGAYLFAIFCALMLLNGVWHAAASLYLHTYAPGVVTAVLVVLPVTIYLLRRGIREKYF